MNSARGWTRTRRVALAFLAALVVILPLCLTGGQETLMVIAMRGVAIGRERLSSDSESAASTDNAQSTSTTSAPSAPALKPGASPDRPLHGSVGEKQDTKVEPQQATAAPAPKADTAGLSEHICWHTPFRPKGRECMLIGKQGFCNSTTRSVADLSQESRYRRCLRRGSCAIIGSSAHLLSEQWGPLIDGHDATIRINSAPAGIGGNSGWAKHVGSTTHVRFSNQFGDANMEENGLPLCLFLHEPDLKCRGPCWITPGPCTLDECNFAGQQCRGHRQRGPVPWAEPQDRRTVILDSVHADVADQLTRGSGGKIRTAGMIGFAYALHACDHVSVFGFGPGCDGKLGARYYKNTEAVQLFHGYSFETRVLVNATNGIFPKLPSDWVRAKSVKYYWPKCLKPPPGLTGP
mmetsp:Transcript_18606/g.38710  ORF Transcript_18606/g.38710 Transcript_18606/m.38710 type:complete len:406 (-) Transcript_18606:40-1257(-)